MPQKKTDSKFSGLEAGRLVLRDLAKIYENLNKGLPPEGLLSEERRLELVAALDTPEEVRRFNDFRYLHEYLTRAALTATIHRQASEAAFWQIMYSLKSMYGLKSRTGKIIFQDRDCPIRIMTRKQYDDLASRSLPLFQNQSAQLPDDQAPVAVLRPEDESKAAALIDERGYFRNPDEHDDFFNPVEPENLFKSAIEAVEAFHRAVREYLVIRTAVEIIGKFVEVPEIITIIEPTDEEHLADVSRILDSVRRFHPEPPPELAERFQAALKPRGLNELAPSAAARRRAGKAVGFNTVQGHIEEFYQILREDRPA